MNKYKIVALFGKAGSGKDYIQKKIMETDFGKENLSEIISCTTRPPREGEIDGVHYHFISEEEFFSKTWLEFTEFRGWYYGTPITKLKRDKINIGIFNIAGIYTILKNKNIECLPVYIKTYPKIRLLRQLQRENEPNCDEIVRRYMTDQKDFLKIPFHHYIIENNYDEIQHIINDLSYLIKEEFSISIKEEWTK